MSGSSITSVTTRRSGANTFSPVVTASRNIRSIPNVMVGSDRQLTVHGSTDGVVVCCTLIRHGVSDQNEPNETIGTETRFTTASSSAWRVVFNLKHQATYLVTCHSRNSSGVADPTINDYVEVLITGIDGASNARNTHLSIEESQFLTTGISASGTVLYPFNPITFTITQTNSATGESVNPTPPTVPSGVTTLGGSTSTLQTPANSNPDFAITASYVTSTDPNLNGFSWNVMIAPSPSGTSFNVGDTYMLQVMAAGEGTASTSGTIMAPTVTATQ